MGWDFFKINKNIERKDIMGLHRTKKGTKKDKKSPTVIRRKTRPKKKQKVKSKENPKEKRRVGRPKKNLDILLTEREQCFADLILDNLYRSSKKKLPQYQCYMKAWPEVTEASAHVLATKLLKKEAIQDYIKARKKAAAKRVELNVEMVLRGLLRIAMFDPRRLYKENGHLKRIIDLDDDTALAIHGIKYRNIQLGRGTKKRIKTVIDSVQTESRKQAWELLGTHLNMWEGNTNTSPEEFVNDVRTFAVGVQNAVPGGKI